MLSFKDRTYCASPDCINKCDRKITNEEKELAKSLFLPIWWGFFCGEVSATELHAHIKKEFNDVALE